MLEPRLARAVLALLVCELRMTYLLSDQDTRGTKELVSVLRSGQVTNLPFCAFFRCFPPISSWCVEVGGTSSAGQKPR